MLKCYVRESALDMSTDPDRKTACPDVLQPSQFGETATAKQSEPNDGIVRTKPEKDQRRVSFPPDDEQLVTKYFEPANPWHDGRCSAFGIRSTFSLFIEFSLLIELSSY